MINLLLVLSTVLCTYLAYNIPNLNFTMFFALIPLFFLFLYRIKSFRESLIYSFLFSLLYYILNFSWFTSLYPLDWLGFSKYQSLIIIIGGLLFISIKQSLTLFLIGLIPDKIRKNTFKSLLYIPILWVLIEYIQQLGPLALPWLRIYLSQSYNTYFIQMSNIFGSLFISFIVILINMLLLKSIMNKNIKYIYAVVLILIISYSYGYYSVSHPYNYSYKVNCSIVQANISSEEKWNSNSLNEIISAHLALSKSEFDKNKPAIIVWGETAIPTFLDDNTISKIRNFTNQTNSVLVTGCFNYNQSKWYNSIAAIDTDTIKFYNKSHLVPFGEYIPLRNIVSRFLPASGMLNAFGEDLTSGIKSAKITINKYNIACLICFESLFSNIAREAAKSADFMIVVSNDSWYKDSYGVYQHNAHNIFRAIENNKYIVRAANSGISSIIDNHGIIIKSLKPLQKGSLNSEVYANNRTTFYSKYGDNFIYLCAITLIILIAKKEKKDSL